MPSKTVEFVVTPTSGVTAYWLQAGDKGVPLVNGKGSVSLDASKRHTLIWWMKGNPGGAISIVGKSGGTLVVQIKESKIPDGELEGAGIKRFDL